MRERLTDLLTAHLLAVGVTAVAVGARWLVDPWLGDHLPLITVFAAVAAAVWHGGHRPALLAAGLGYLACEYLFIPPRGSIGARDVSSLVGFVAYVGSCSIIIGLGEAARRARGRASAGRDLLRVTLGSIGDGVITTDPEGRVTYLNRVAESLTGWVQAEAAGQPLDAVFRIVNEETREPVEGPAVRALREGVVVGLANHTLLIARDGTERPIDDSAAPIRDEQGHVVGCVLVFRDVTDRRQVDQALARSERDLADFFANASVGLHWVGPDGAILRVNQAELDLLGYREEEYVGRPITDFHVDRAVIDDILARLKRGETVRECPARLRCKDGSVREVLISSSVLFEGGRFIHTRCFTIDVTDRRRAAVAQAHLAALVAASDDAIVSKSLDGTILSWNGGAERLFGYTAAEALGRSIHLVIPPELREEEASILGRLRRGERVEHFETVRVAKDGRRVNISLSISPILDDAGRVVAASKVARDITERRRAEEALRESEQRFRLMADAAPVMIWISGADKRCTWFNRQWLEFVGRPIEREVGTVWGENIHPEDRDRCLATYTAAFDAREPFLMDYRLRRHDGEYRWVVDNGTPLYGPGQGLVGFIGSCVDITERKRAEEERQQFFALAESSGEFVGLCDAAMAPIYVNAAGLRMVGLDSVEQARRVPVAEFFFPEDRPYILDEFFPRVLREGRGEVETRFRHFKTGQSLWVIYSVVALADERGRPSGFGTVTRDITERKLAEQALAAAARQLRLVTNNAPVMIAHCDAEGRYRFVNAAYAEYFGLAPDDMIGRPIPEVLGGEVYTAIRTYLDEALAGATVEFDVELPHPALGPQYMRCAYRPERDGEGRIVGLVAAIVNITERRRAEEALREADRRKDEFLATLAHELRNPLAPVRNSLEILKRAGADAGVVDRALGTMDRQVSVMERLIDDLLDISRINRNRLELRRQAVELASVVHHAVEACRPLADRSRHDVSVSLPAEPVWVNGDPVRLAQVFSNLLNNACKYTGAGGRIRLAAERRGGEVVVSVKDNGIGIPREMLPRVFEMFAQVDQTLERSHGGLGIGLTLVKQLVELHGGRVEARSGGPGLGSELVVTLPVLERKPEAERPAVAAPPQAPPRRILVADDNRDGAESLAMLLKLAGQETEVAYDGLAAVEAAERFRPDVALLDIGMPKLNGYDVCRRIREQGWGQGMVLVAVTGWGQDEDRRKTKEAGFDAHLVKPVDHAELMRLLAGLPNGSGDGAGSSGHGGGGP